jgi:hypothetical protein
VTDDNKQRIEVQVEPLPFTEVNVVNPDELLRQWIFREIQNSEVATNKTTLDYMENVYQWIKNGSPKPKVRAVE